MTYLIIIGWLFWVIVAFIGSRQSYLQGSGFLQGFFHHLKSRSPALLALFILACFAISFYLCFKEISGIRNDAGVIGIYFLASVLTGMAGSFGLSAAIYLGREP